MRFQGSVIKEQGVTFGIIVVKPHVLNNPSARTGMQSFGVRAFGNMPIVLMAQHSTGRATYWGRSDLTKFLSRVPLGCIPWREYQIS